MPIRTIAEVDARLEKAVLALSDECLLPQEMYDLYEQAAISMLDSEFDDYPDGELEVYLMGYLEMKRNILGLNG